MPLTKDDLDNATDAWLKSYEAYEQYIEATSKLFTVFADGWGGSPRTLQEAFNSYCKAIGGERGLKFEAKEVRGP